MNRYLYPQNLKATAKLWLWGMKDFIILSVMALISVVILAKTGFALLGAITLCYGFMTIRLDETTVLDFIKYSLKYLISSQQYYEWR